MSRRRITMVIRELGCGGAQRVLCTLAEGLLAAGHEVDVVTFSPRVADFFALPQEARRHQAGHELQEVFRWHEVRSRWRRFGRLRELILRARPEVVISFEEITNLEVRLALFGSGVPVIATEHSDPREHRIGLRWRVLRYLLYPGAAAVVVLNASIEAWAKSRWPRWNVVAIPNPIHRMPRDVPDARRGNRLMAVGRLVEQKGFDRMIEAFARVAVTMPGWTLTIHGDGPERGRLEALVREHDLEGRVRLPGASPDLSAEYAAADMMVVSSRYEGFCMALVEAMAVGTPVISFDCPTGPREIVRPGIDGILVPAGDVHAMAEAMLELMQDPAKRRRLGEAARGVGERYSMEAVLGRWERLLGTMESA